MPATTTALTRSQLHDLAAKVAAEMGWEPDPGNDPDEDWFAVIRAIDQTAAVSISARSGEPSMLHAGGRYPHTNYYFRDGERGSMNVTWSRGTHAIAADIQRKLVPTVTQTMAKIREYDQHEAADTAARLALVDRILSMFPERTHMPSHMQQPHRSQVIVNLGPKLSLLGGTLDMMTDGHEVEFERFRVPGETAVRMLAAISAATPA